MMTLKNRIAKATAIALMTTLTLTGVALTAIAYSGMVPIEIDPDRKVTPNSTAPFSVRQTAAGQIRITSSPAGAVSYQGYAGVADHVTATTGANATGIITVYLTSGTTTVSKTFDTANPGGI